MKDSYDFCLDAIDSMKKTLEEQKIKLGFLKSVINYLPEPKMSVCWMCLAAYEEQPFLIGRLFDHNEAGEIS